MKSTERTAWRTRGRILPAVGLAVALAVVAACSGGGSEPAGTEVKGVTYERPDASRGGEAPSALTPKANVTTAAPTTAPPDSAPTTTSPTTTTTTTEPPPPAEPAIIEVRYVPGEGDEVTASLEGTGRNLPLAGGVAIFDGLPDGTYQVIIEIIHPPTGSDGGPVGLGPATELIRSVPITVVAGDHAVVSCADDCTAVL